MADFSEVPVPSTSTNGDLPPPIDNAEPALRSEPLLRKEVRKVCKKLRHACDSLEEGNAALEQFYGTLSEIVGSDAPIVDDDVEDVVKYLQLNSLEAASKKHLAKIEKRLGKVMDRIKSIRVRLRGSNSTPSESDADVTASLAETISDDSDNEQGNGEPEDVASLDDDADDEHPEDVIASASQNDQSLASLVGRSGSVSSLSSIVFLDDEASSQNDTRTSMPKLSPAKKEHNTTAESLAGTINVSSSVSSHDNYSAKGSRSSMPVLTPTENTTTVGDDPDMQLIEHAPTVSTQSHAQEQVANGGGHVPKLVLVQEGQAYRHKDGEVGIQDAENVQPVLEEATHGADDALNHSADNVPADDDSDERELQEDANSSAIWTNDWEGTSFAEAVDENEVSVLAQARPSSAEPTFEHINGENVVIASVQASNVVTEDEVRKCRKLFSSLLRLADHKKMPRLKLLVKKASFTNMSAKNFLHELEAATRSVSKAGTYPFILKTLPALRKALRCGEIEIDGLGTKADYEKEFPPGEADKNAEPVRRSAAAEVDRPTQAAPNVEWDTLSNASTVAIDDVNAETSAPADPEQQPLPAPVDKDFEKRLLKANGFAKFQLALPARLADQCNPQEDEELDAEIRAISRAYDQRYPPPRRNRTEDRLLREAKKLLRQGLPGSDEESDQEDGIMILSSDSDSEKPIRTRSAKENARKAAASKKRESDEDSDDGSPWKRKTTKRNGHLLSSDDESTSKTTQQRKRKNPDRKKEAASDNKEEATDGDSEGTYSESLAGSDDSLLQRAEKQKKSFTLSSDDDEDKKRKDGKRKKDKDSDNLDASSDGEKDKKKRRSKRLDKPSTKGKPPGKKRRTVRVKLDSDSDEEASSSDSEIRIVKKKDAPKKEVRFRPMMAKRDLKESTIHAEKAERERRKRLEQKQREFNGIELYNPDESGSSDLAGALASTSSGGIRFLTKVELDQDKAGDPPCPVSVHPSLVRVLKPHQAKGIRFIYDSVIESLERLDSTDGGGGILAHCMGLGKTLQVIAFLHTILTHAKTSEFIRKVLVVVPKNVVINWKKEFEKWLTDELDVINVMEIDTLKGYKNKLEALRNWHECDEPSVMICGYEMFRILTDTDQDRAKGAKPKVAKSKTAKELAKLKQDFQGFLQNPGPDLVVCDEAHKLKNSETALTKAMNKIATRRRLALTGTPLQNHVLEYHCMVSFVKPGLLGTKKEFSNRFANIINRGRTIDASGPEVRAMKRRCHVLYKFLDKVLDRKDWRVLTEAIPPKQEYVLYIRLTPAQIQLYRHFLVVAKKDVLPDYHVFSRIWTHPHLLLRHEAELERRAILKGDDLDDFVVNDEDVSSSNSGDDDDDNDIEILSDEENPGANGTRAGPSTSKAGRRSKRIAGEEAPERPETPPEYRGWYSRLGLISDEDRYNYEMSNKLFVLQQIIKKCEEIGDKLLVFSQSLESLALIKRMLEYLHNEDKWFVDGHEALRAEGEEWGWAPGLDFLMITGSVSGPQRHELQTRFNNPENLRARLMLISTRAGSLGTNMIAANRVVIFDSSWNPSHDTQSLFRVYRFGQTKPVYIYRFVAQGTMEERIYKRQVTKEAVAMRVVDEAQIQRHFNQHDLDQMYDFDPAPEPEEAVAPRLQPPRDRLLAELIRSHEKCLTDYIEHDSLFIEQEAERLTEEEARDAWKEYEHEQDQTRQAQQRAENFVQMQQEQARLRAEFAQQQAATIPHQPMFRVCMEAGIPAMNVGAASYVTTVKQFLDGLLPKIPPENRGGVNDFENFFNTEIASAQRSGAAYLVNVVTDTFRKVVNAVRGVPSCQQTLRAYYAVAPQFFDPALPAP